MKPESKIPRWTAWARSLAGRHGRQHERLDRLSLQLARPRGLARSVQQRWFLSSRVMQPRIALAIQPVLRASFWRTPERVERIARTATTRTVETRTAHREQVREVERYRETERVFAEQRPALLKVFERLRETGQALGPIGRQGRAVETTALARTLAARARREEKALSGEPPARVFRPTEQPVREERRSLPDPRRSEIPGWGAPASSFHGTMPVPVPPPINVESLTDQVMRQIDRRVGAWRERTGGF
jgi:hypothetical protein